MLSENKLQRKRLGNNYLPEGTVRDTQDAERDGDNYDFLIKAGLATAGLIGLYKTGALQPVMKSIFKYGSKIAKHPEDFLYSKSTALENWAKFNNMSDGMLHKLGMENTTIPANSIFRNNKFNVLKTIINDAYESAKNGKIDFSRTKTIISDTEKDLDILHQITDKQKGITKNIVTKYYDTDLLHGMKNIKEEFQEIDYKIEGRGYLAKTKIIEEFIKENSLSEAERLTQLKRKGIRNIVLGDLFETPNPEIKEFGRTAINLKQDMINKINLMDGGVGDTSYDKIKAFMQDPMKMFVDPTTKKTYNMISGWDKTKNLILDRSIYIDEKTGEIIDTRMTNKIVNEFKRSFVSNFQIPGLGFNPIGSLKPDWARGTSKNDMFGVIQKTRIDPVLTGRGGRVTVGEVFGDDIIVINGKAFKAGSLFRDEDIIMSGLKLNDITYRESTGLGKMADTVRHIAGLDFKELGELSAEEIAKLSPKKKFYYDMSRWLDFGGADLDAKAKREFLKKTKSINPDDLDDYFSKFNPDSKVFGEWIHDFLSKDIVQPPRSVLNEHTYGDIFGNGYGTVVDSNGNKRLFREYLTTREKFTMKDVINGKKTMKEWGAQFFAGRNKYNQISENFTERSASIYSVVNNIEEKIAGLGKILGLSNESKKSTGDIFKNFMLKRVLPIYALLQLPNMIDTISEPIFSLFGQEDQDGTGNKMNARKFLIGNVVKPVDIGFHYVKDTLGITSIAKTFEKYTPGFDQITEFPGLHALGLTQTAEERKEYIKKGVDAVRKGRYWSLGNTPFTGGKIMYFRPNIYRRVAADVDFSDSKWGSRQEYYNNTWYPNPINPLAPLNHFIFDRNHYDKKHYKDRPYLQTSPAGGQIPLIGPIFSATAGKVINPPKKMHQEYWENGPVQKDDEIGIQQIIESQNSRSKSNIFSMIQQAFVDQDTIKSNYTKTVASQQNAIKSRTYNVQRAKKLVQSSIDLNSGVLMSQYNILPKNSMDVSKSQLELYTTPSGGMSIIDIPDDMSTYEANQQLKKYSIRKFEEANTRPEINQFRPTIADYSDKALQNDFITGLGEQYNNLANVFGMKGFEMQAFVTGKANQDISQIENSSYAYSFNKSFWDENLGGMGDDISEMFRRFVQKRNDNIDYINPIRNTMPSWMPGRNYFTDFKHGDPYSKIDNGEERLPGEGYERLYGINTKQLLKLSIGSSFLGKDVATMQKHLLNADDPFTAYAQEVTEKGTEMHNAIEKQWKDSGFAISIEGKIEDNKNNILGFYDAMVHDQESPTGITIADIKTVSDKKFKKVQKENKPFYENKAQVNYYLWATGNTDSLGGIYYVNRDNPEQTQWVKFNFDKNLLKENLTNLDIARQNIYKGLKNGTIGRGELYNPLDRYRILADVAPYSEEFRKAKTKLEKENLTSKQQEEVSAIGERVKQQKEPLRVYDYKFKTSNLQTKNVKVKRLINPNMILVNMDGKDQAIRFAGINVKSSNSEKYDKKQSYKKASEKQLRKYIRKGSIIQIRYDADNEKKYNKDSTKSIKAVVMARGININHMMLKKELATEDKDDNTPAGIRAKYTKRQIVFGSAMERATHWFSNNIPYFGSKFLNVRSPYEQYRKKEVYGKDFQSWNHPIRDFLTPVTNELSSKKGFGAIIAGAFIGSLFGKKGNLFGKLVGAGIGATVAGIGRAHTIGNQIATGETWVPKRRQKQRELNEYMDMLKYIKNMRLYEQYKEKAKKENHIDVDKITNNKQIHGIVNKAKKNELEKFKKQVKLDYKHRKSYNFKYINSDDFDMEATQKDLIHQINAKITEISSDRKIERTSDNVLKALAYRQAAQETFYAFDKGDSLQDYLKALPKKERQYYKYLANAPEEEKEQILAIAPSYLKRGLQSAWGRKMDEKPQLEEYFADHSLPDANWVGWDENTNLESVKVKMVHMNKLDPGEFDIWQDQIKEANEVNIPVPIINAPSDITKARRKLQGLLGQTGYSEVRVDAIKSNKINKIRFDIKEDQRDSIRDAMSNMNL